LAKSVAALVALFIVSAGTVWLWNPGAFLADDLSLVHAGRHMVTEDFFRPFYSSWVWHDIAPSWRYLNYIRPVTLFTFGVDWSLWGFAAARYYVTTALLHFGCAVLVFALGRAVLGRENLFGAYVAALLFALHPAHEYNLLWLSGRGDILATLFTLASLLALVRLVRAPSWWASLLHAALTFAALFSKENAFAIPLLAAALLAWIQWPLRPNLGSLRKCWPVAVSLACAAAVIALRLIVFAGQPMAPKSDVSLVDVAASAWKFARNLVLPFHFSLRDAVTTYPVSLGIFALCVLVFVALGLKRALRMRLLFWIMLTGLACAPNLRIFFPWYAYLPSAFFCLMMGDFFGAQPRPKLGERGYGVVVVGIMILLSVYWFGWGLRGPVWDFAGRFSDLFVAQYKEVASKNPDREVVLLTAPGGIAAIPIFYHNLSARLALEEGSFDKDPEVGVLVESPNLSIEAFNTAVTPDGPFTWHVSTQAEGGFLSPPSRYREATTPPIPRTTVTQYDARGQPTAVSVNLQSLAEQPPLILYYTEGELQTLQP
jgi:hypothetical protein